MSLINCEVNHILIWSANCGISEGFRQTAFAKTYIKLFVPVVR